MTRKEFISHVESTQIALRRFLVALCGGDAFMADDIAQESYMKAWLSCDGFRDESKFKAWIFRIAYNSFISATRCRRPADDVDQAHGVASAEQTDARFKYQALNEALRQLPIKERTALLLHYMQGYAVKEIAEIVEATPEAVRQHLSRGRSKLRHLLDPDEFTD